jgi:hypothetical protein
MTKEELQSNSFTKQALKQSTSDSTFGLAKFGTAKFGQSFEKEGLTSNSYSKNSLNSTVFTDEALSINTHNKEAL